MIAGVISERPSRSSDDDRFGSLELRDATVRQTLEETRTIDFSEVVERRPTYRALGLAAATVAVLLGVVVAEPGLSRVAARRLFLPFGADQPLPPVLAEQVVATPAGQGFTQTVPEVQGVVVGFVAGSVTPTFEEVREQLAQQAGTEADQAGAQVTFRNKTPIASARSWPLRPPRRGSTTC